MWLVVSLVVARLVLVPLFPHCVSLAGKSRPVEYFRSLALKGCANATQRAGRAVTQAQPFDLLRPGRSILGASAVLLPFDDSGEADTTTFAALIERTLAAGLVPAVNMDTGYGALLSPRQRQDLVELAMKVAEGAGQAGSPALGGAPLLAGAYVDDRPGDPWAADDAVAAVEAIATCGAIPVVFPSYGLASLEPDELVDAFRLIGDRCDRFVGFELGEMFVPAGRIWDLDTYSALMAIRSCIGAKHSSLVATSNGTGSDGGDRMRPDFHVFTGNDLAIDMVMYGSDYLLGLSAFAPEAFAERDRRWASGDRAFLELNDLLQCLGTSRSARRCPRTATTRRYSCTCGGRIRTDRHPPGAPVAPRATAVLADIAERLEAML